MIDECVAALRRRWRWVGQREDPSRVTGKEARKKVENEQKQLIIRQWQTWGERGCGNNSSLITLAHCTELNTTVTHYRVMQARESKNLPFWSDWTACQTCITVLYWYPLSFSLTHTQPNQSRQIEIELTRQWVFELKIENSKAYTGLVCAFFCW